MVLVLQSTSSTTASLTLLLLHPFLWPPVYLSSSPISSALCYDIFFFLKEPANINLFLSFASTSLPLSVPIPPIHTKQSVHILRWREKTTRKMTSAPENSQRNGVKVRVGQRSRREKVGRKEGGWERESERQENMEERKGGSRCFWINKTCEPSQV